MQHGPKVRREARYRAWGVSSYFNLHYCRYAAMLSVSENRKNLPTSYGVANGSTRSPLKQARDSGIPEKPCQAFPPDQLTAQQSQSAETDNEAVASLAPGCIDRRLSSTTSAEGRVGRIMASAERIECHLGQASRKLKSPVGGAVELTIIVVESRIVVHPFWTCVYHPASTLSKSLHPQPVCVVFTVIATITS